MTSHNRGNITNRRCEILHTHTHTVETDGIVGGGVTPLVFPLCL